jgi:hypothetical protein
MTNLIDKYFTILEDYFGGVYSAVKEEPNNYGKIEKTITEVYRGSAFRQSTMETLYEELSKLNWSDQDISIQKTASLKVSYLGSDCHEYWNTILPFVKKCGLYADTIIINENVLSSLRRVEKNQLFSDICFRSIVKSAFSYFSIKDLFFADNFDPVCTLASSQTKSRLNCNLDLVNLITTDFASEVLETKFDTIDDVKKHISKFNTLSAFMSACKKKLVTPEGDLMPADYIEWLFGNTDTLDSIHGSPPESYLNYLTLLAVQNEPVVDHLMANAKYRANFATDFRVFGTHYSG